MKLVVNGQTQEVDAPADMPVPWVLRDLVGLTGTEFGCGMALCGACTVHVDGQPVRACMTPASAVGDAPITTIDVVQCGYCQSGQVMAAAALPARNRAPIAPAVGHARFALTGKRLRTLPFRLA